MPRKSEQKMKSEVGDSREARIGTMIATSFTNDAIMSAFEQEDTSLIPDKDTRRKEKKKGHTMLPFDDLRRQRLQEAIRSVRKQYTDEDNDIGEMLGMIGDGEMKSIGDVALTNIHRFSCGVPAMDYIYGLTAYIHLTGTKRGEETGKVEEGLPEAFLSIWAGSPGVGKTRLAIAMTKSLNRLGHLVLYYNGEAEESQFRTWCGADVDSKLFKVRSTDCLRLQKIVDDAYKYKPKVIIVDSLQMIAEAEKGGRGIKTVLSRFKLLKQEEAAGRPHIIFISQLNKKGELAGSRFIEHMVDFVGQARKIEGRQGQFLFECPRKNRGGATPRSASFRHINGTVECLSMDRQADHLKLIQRNIVTGPAVDGEPEPVVQRFVPEPVAFENG